MKCKTCHSVIQPDCDYKQGRCPHRKPMIEIQPKDTSRGHFYVSLAKSFIRIGAGCWLMTGNFLIAGVCVILAEVLGILEELV
jgi:acetyltransferase-like isoleucine patch superfamily enzyme